MGNQEKSTIIYNQALPNSQVQGFTSIYRKKGLKTFVESPDPSIHTIRDVLKSIKSKYGTNPGLGYVTVAKGMEQNGQETEQRTIKSNSYNQVYESAHNLGRSLFKRNLYFEEPIQHMRLIGIYSKNRYEWFITDWACVLFGLTSVPLYDTLGVQNLTYCLNQTEMTTLFVCSSSIKSFLGLKDIGKIKNIISFDPLDQINLGQLKTRGFTYFSYLQLINEGSKLNTLQCDTIPIRRQQCYTFSYTSGTTGPPKGAMISHRNMLAGISALVTSEQLVFTSNDRHISYLPLPHLLERIFSLSMFYVGAYIIISSGNTLKLKEDCGIIKPTVFLSVPRLFNKIYEAIRTKFQNQTGIKKCLIDSAVETKLKTAKETGEFTHCLYDSLIFSKVRQGFGGCIRLLCTGSAPISPEVQVFLKMAMACPFLQGYGQTQSTGISLTNRSLDTNYGTLCETSTGLEVRLCDIPQMKYTSKDVDQQGKSTPRGEIWVRGPMVFMGYYKQPELTKQTINQQGWLKTGDVAQFNPELNSYRIIDRKKNIFKLQQGQYLAPDRIQNKYLKSNLISQIFLHGDSQQYFAVAIATPNKDEIISLAQSKGIKGTYTQLCNNREIRQLVLIALNQVGKKQGLNGFELAKNIFLQENSFQARGILTNTMKLIRYQARQYYKSQIQQLYQEGQLPAK